MSTEHYTDAPVTVTKKFPKCQRKTCKGEKLQLEEMNEKRGSKCQKCWKKGVSVKILQLYFKKEVKIRLHSATLNR